MTSILEWTRRLPTGWQVVPLRALADYVVSNVDKVPADGEQPVRLCNYSDVYNNEFVTQQLDFMPCTATEEEIRKFRVEVTDVIITKDSESWNDIGIPALVTETADDLVCGYHLALLRPHREKVVGGFLFRCLQAKVLRLQLELAANGVTRFGLPKADIGAMRLPVPPLDTQLAIVSELDRETVQIDSLVAAKQRILDLLAEKRKAIIASAVTRGIDPKAKLRDSGVPWLGEIPEHWPLVPLRYLVSFLSGGTPDKGNAAFWVGGTIPWVSPKDMKVELIDDSEDHITEEAIDGSATRLVPVGSILIVVRGMILAHTLPVAMTAGPITINQDIKALVCGDRLLPDFLRIVLAGQSRLLLSLTDSSAHGTKKMETEVLQQLEVPVPALDEQRAIVEHIARETAKLDAVRAATERTIALLRERRAALIAAAVTGQIDVEEVA